jgi:hypothetical protein
MSNEVETYFAKSRLPDRPEDMTESDFELLRALAEKVVRRRLAVPAIFFLESTKPLNYIGSQAMVFFGPFVRVLFESPNYYRYSELLEQRSTLELLLQMIEGYESDLASADKASREARKSSRRRPAWQFWRRRS